MKSHFIVFALLIGVSKAFTQTVTVVDRVTRQPVIGAALFSPDPIASATTNALGQSDISAFFGSDSIVITHVSYKTRAFSYDHLKDMRFVEMTEAVIPLAEIVVSASRSEESRRDVPHYLETIRVAEIILMNPQTAADLLAISGAVYIQKSQLAGGSPMIRGFAANRVLLVVDGVRMNNAIFRSGNVQNVISLDAFSIQTAEILFGPGTVLYGSDAIGGVMDFTTLDPRFSEQRHHISGTGVTRYSSATGEQSVHVDLLAGFSSFAFATSFTSSRFGDLRSGTHGNEYFLRPTYQERISGIDSQLVNSDPTLQIHSGYRQTNFIQKFRFKPETTWDLEYGLYYSATSDAPRYDRLSLDADNNGILDFAQWYYGPQHWIMNRLGLSRSNRTTFYDHFRLTAAVQNYEESRHDRRTGNPRLRSQTETVDALSLAIDLKKQADEHSVLYYGVEAISNIIGSRAIGLHIENGFAEPTNTRYPDGATWNSYGAYAKLKHFVTPTLTINAGLRYALHSMEAEFDTSRFPFPFAHAANRSAALSGSIGAVFYSNSAWSFYVNGTTGYRAPNIDDIGKVFESEPGSVIVPNPDLKPEYAYNIEIGSTGRFRELLEVNCSIYYTFLDNALARRDFSYNGQDSILYDGQRSRVQAIQNIANAFIYGLQAGVRFRLGDGFSIRSQYSYQYGREQDADNLSYSPLRHAAPAFGSTHLVYEREGLKLDLHVLYNDDMRYEDLALSERGDPAPYAKDKHGNPFVPGWYTLNFKGSVLLGHFTVNIGLENITDQLYRPYASGISAPGRNFVLSLKGSVE
ncbi:MAG: TonB-dependent receptor [Bacteroidota bacterium]